MSRIVHSAALAVGPLAAWALGAGCANAVTIPPAIFTNDVRVGGASQCPGSTNASQDGFCVVGGNVAHSDGGIPGTPGYDPSLGPGTHVSAMVVDQTVSATGSMQYYFLIGGPPVPGGQIAVNVMSSGFATVLTPPGSKGKSSAEVSMTIVDEGPDSGVGNGVPDPDPSGPVASHSDSVVCTSAGCKQKGMPWGTSDSLFTDRLCLTQGDLYEITIIAEATVGALHTGAFAAIDPRIRVDPVNVDPPAECFQATNPLDYPISISAGASTGAPVPEPDTLALLAGGLAVSALAQARRRRASGGCG
jgi:hypothetical protein